MVREHFQVPNRALEQPKLNILTWLQVLNSSTKFEEFKNFGREVRNFDGARRIFYEVKWHIFSISKKVWLVASAHHCRHFGPISASNFKRM